MVGKLRATVFIIFVITIFSFTSVFAEVEIDWISGGRTVELSDLATLDLDESLLFLNADDTKKLFAYYNPSEVTDLEIGSVWPENEEETWFLLFEYEESGHIKDADKEEIDADAILESYKVGTEEQNKNRDPEDHLFVKGWDIAPFYDEVTHNLTWSLLLHDQYDRQVINYNVRILTRQGNISAILVSDPENLQKDIKILNELIMPYFEVNSGQRYEDFDPSKDKVADYGLAALILGGAGIAVAKKTGLIALLILVLRKGWFIIIAAIAGIWKFIPNIRNKKQQNPYSRENSEDQTNQNNEVTPE